MSGTAPSRNGHDTPPHDRLAEQVVLGSMMQDAAAADAVLSILRQGDWYDVAHQILYRHLAAMRAAGEPMDPDLLAARLRTAGDLQEGKPLSDAGGISYLTELVYAAPTASNAKHYAQIVRDRAELRHLRQLGNRIIGFTEAGWEAAAAWEQAAEAFTVQGASIADDDAGEPISFGDLEDAYPDLQKPLIGGLLRRGETANIIAASKAGKSWLAYVITMSALTAGDLFGRFGCAACRVLLIDNELHKGTLNYRIGRVADALEIDRGLLREQLTVWPLRGKNLDLYGISRKLKRIKPTFDLIILDTLYRALPAGVSENDNAAMMQLYNEIDAIVGKLDCAWLNVHHSSKGNQSDKAITDVGSGAGAQSRAADTHIVLRPHEEPDVVVLEAAVRSFAPVEPLPLRWEFPLWLPVDVDPSRLKRQPSRSEEKQQTADKQGMDQIIDALRHSEGDGLTLKKIRDLTGMGPPRAARLCFALEKAGQIVGEEITSRGQETTLYRLA